MTTITESDRKDEFPSVGDRIALALAPVATVAFLVALMAGAGGARWEWPAMLGSAGMLVLAGAWLKVWGLLDNPELFLIVGSPALAIGMLVPGMAVVIPVGVLIAVAVLVVGVQVPLLLYRGRFVSARVLAWTTLATAFNDLPRDQWCADAGSGVKLRAWDPDPEAERMPPTLLRRRDGEGASLEAITFDSDQFVPPKHGRVVRVLWGSDIPRRARRVQLVRFGLEREPVGYADMRRVYAEQTPERLSKSATRSLATQIRGAAASGR